MSLPYRFFYESLLQPGDDFFTTSRKIMLAVIAVVACYCLFLILKTFNDMRTYAAASQPIVTNLITNQVAMFILVLSGGGCWLYAKRTRTVPDALMDVWLLGGNLSIILMVVGSTGYPWVPMFQTLAIVAVACNTPRLRYHLAVSFVGMFLPWNRLGTFFWLFQATPMLSASQP